MDKPKTKVVKSKSSNSTSENKKNTQKNNKKSRSNAEFQPKTTIYTQGIQPLLKKRGVYVEKKITTTKIPNKNTYHPINNRDQSPDADVLINKPQSSPPRPIPRAGRKRFLASILTILSKSTAGTQFPDITDRLTKMDKTKNKRKKRKDEEVIKEVSLTTTNISKRKPRSRSRVLNNYADSEVEPVVVLQSTKDIAQTPSNNSVSIHDKNTVSTYVNPETLRWAENLPPPAQQNLHTTAPVATYSKKVRLIDNEPTTMIADLPKKIDKNFYNFFVDVLKTSLSVYNVQTELNKELPSSSNSSKVALEINESVAGKLNTMQKIKEAEFKDTSDVLRKSSSKYVYRIQPGESQQWDDRQLLEHFQPDFSKQSTVGLPQRGRKLKSDSFNYKKVKPLPNTTSLPMPNRRKTQIKDRKKDFINSLKKQLQIKADNYKEPHNFYQALKVIAKNKRRSQQAIDFRASKGPGEGDVHVCHFKRRRVLSAKASAKQSNYYTETRLDPNTFNPYFKTRYKKRKLMVERENEIDESKHSLEVVGYDYETKKSKAQSIYALRPPTPPTLIEDYDLGLIMDYSESGTSAIVIPMKVKSVQCKPVFEKNAHY